MKRPRTKSDDDPILGEMRFPNEWWREVYAAAALGGFLAREESTRAPEILAKLAYQYADAMIACPARQSPRE